MTLTDMPRVAVILFLCLIAAPAHAEQRPELVPPGWILTQSDHFSRWRKFVSPDGRASIATAQVRISPDHGLGPLYRDDERVTYHRRGSSGGIASGYRGGNIFYRKASLACGGTHWNYVELIYPPALKRDVAAILTQITRGMNFVGDDCGPPMRLIGAPKDSDACPSTEFTAFFRAFSTQPELQRRYTKLPFEYGLLHMDRLEDEDEGFKKRMIAKYQDIPQYRKKSGAIFPSAAELKAGGLEFEITTQKNGQPRKNAWPEIIITDPNHATATLILPDTGFQVYYRFRRAAGCWLLIGISDRST